MSEYTQNLVSLASSIASHFGLETAHPTLPVLDSELARGYRNVALLLFDGLGHELITRHAEHLPFLAEQIAARIESVFPPTTTAATTSVESALYPIEHGRLGWSLYIPELDKNVDIYPNTDSADGSPAADYNVAWRFLPYKSIVERINTLGSARAATLSPFSPEQNHRVGDIPSFVDLAAKICAEPGRHYVYGYSPLPDYDMHDLGTSHPRILAELELIDREVHRLHTLAPDTLIIVTADHGMIDVDWRFMDEHPELCRLLVRPPSIEGRAMSFYVKPGKNREFEHLFSELYGDIYDLLTHEDVMSRRLFGEGRPHPRAEACIGNYLAIARTRTTLSWQYDENPFAACHAGGTDFERYVPMILIKSKI